MKDMGTLFVTHRSGKVIKAVAPSLYAKELNDSFAAHEAERARLDDEVQRINAAIASFMAEEARLNADKSRFEAAQAASRERQPKSRPAPGAGTGETPEWLRGVFSSGEADGPTAPLQERWFK